MATINTDNDFREAVRVLIDNSTLTFSGERVVDAQNRKVFDATPHPSPPAEYPNKQVLTDITPNTTTLETALDSAVTEIATATQERQDDANAKSTLLRDAIADLAQNTADQTTAASITDARIRQLILNMLIREERTIKALLATIRSG